MTRAKFDVIMHDIAQGLINVEAAAARTGTTNIAVGGPLMAALNELCTAVVNGEVAPTSVLSEIRELARVMREPEPEPVPEDFYRWRIELTFDVHKSWVADGFDATDRFTGRAAEHFGMEQLPYATGDEVRCSGRVLEKPADERVAGEQGYPNVEAWRAGRERRRG